MDSTVDHLHTSRLDLAHPVPDDVEPLHRICADPRVWTHFPSLRHTSREQTAEMVEHWRAQWEHDGLATWVLRVRGEEIGGEVIGYGGCVLRGGVWNLGYRLAPEHQGKGYATEVSREAIARAREADATLPITAFLLENNPGSLRVAQRVGLELVHRGPDAGNPDPTAVRLVLSDRPLDKEQLAAVTS